MTLKDQAKKLIELAAKSTQKWKDADKWQYDHVMGTSILFEDCEFIEAADPATITALMERLLLLEERNEKLRKALFIYKDRASSNVITFAEIALLETEDKPFKQGETIWECRGCGQMMNGFTCSNCGVNK